jgi:hypothetical protein
MQESIQPPRPSREDIAALAYQLWEKSGRPAGQDVEIWLQAEQSLLSTCKARPQAASPVPRSVPPPPAKPAAPKFSGFRAKTPTPKAS